KFALMQLNASIFTGPTLAQTAMEDAKPRLLEETKTPSAHTCKFEFINRSAVPIYVITVGRTPLKDGTHAQINFPPLSWDSAGTWGRDASPEGWFASLGSESLPSAPSIRYSLQWQAKSMDTALQPQKSLRLTLEMNPLETIGCDQLHWSSRQVGDNPPGKVVAIVPLTPQDRIDEEVHRVNSQLGLGRAIQKEPVCQTGWSWCEFQTIFLDAQDRVRKIVEWAEGTRQATSKSSVQLRSIWEWYYDDDGNPILLSERYEGEPGSGSVQEHIVYLKDGRIVSRLEGYTSIPAFSPEPEPHNFNTIADARSKLKVAKQFVKGRDPNSL